MLSTSSYAGLRFANNLWSYSHVKKVFLRTTSTSVPASVPAHVLCVLTIKKDIHLPIYRYILIDMIYFLCYHFRSDDTCVVKIPANSNFDINYSPTLQTVFSDKDTILYQGFSCDCQGKQLPAGIFYILKKSCATLKSLTLNNLPNDCRVCIYDLFNRLQLDQYNQLEVLALSRMYKDECYIRLADNVAFPFNITHLTLYGIGLVAVPDTIRKLKSLTHLSLANNIITKMDCLVENEKETLKNLVKLDMRENLLTVVPQEIERLSRLKVLDFSNNCLKKTIPDTIANLHGLTELLLQWNRLESVPTEALCQLKSLKVLDLSHNKLKKISKDICFHISLKFLNLSGNLGLVFHQTDKSSQTDSALQELNISSTTMCFLPSFLSDLKRLKVLDCEHNSISNVDIITTVPNLERAYFRSNHISDGSKVMCHLHNTCTSKLTLLDLVDNHLVTRTGEDSIEVNSTMILLNEVKETLQPADSTRRHSSKTLPQPHKPQWICCS